MTACTSVTLISEGAERLREAFLPYLHDKDDSAIFADLATPQACWGWASGGTQSGLKPLEKRYLGRERFESNSEGLQSSALKY